jgi:hypothetical protein
VRSLSLSLRNELYVHRFQDVLTPGRSSLKPDNATNTVFVACHSELIRKRVLGDIKVAGVGKRRKRAKGGIIVEIEDTDLDVPMSDDEAHD